MSYLSCSPKYHIARGLDRDYSHRSVFEKTTHEDVNELPWENKDAVAVGVDYLQTGSAVKPALPSGWKIDVFRTPVTTGENSNDAALNTSAQWMTAGVALVIGVLLYQWLFSN